MVSHNWGLRAGPGASLEVPWAWVRRGGLVTLLVGAEDACSAKERAECGGRSNGAGYSTWGGAASWDRSPMQTRRSAIALTLNP